MAELSFPDFRDKMVAIVFSDDEETPWTVLENTRFELQGGRVFLMGTVPEGVNEDDWCAGATVGIAWDDVLSYYLFDSVDDYLEKIGEA